MFLICVSGFSGVGKDEFCKQLSLHYETNIVGLADPAKRHMADLYGFTEDQLFGPSQFRNAGDLRYPKAKLNEEGFKPASPELKQRLLLDYKKNYWYSNYSISCASLNKSILRIDDIPFFVIEEGDPEFWLSPREALQKYCALMNDLYPDSWIDKGISVQKQLATNRYSYSRIGGLKEKQYYDERDHTITIGCFSDFRHKNEIISARKINDQNITTVLVRIKSKKISKPPYDHKSETEQATIPDSDFDIIINNNGSIVDLWRSAGHMMSILRDKQMFLKPYIIGI